jgi:geranylgeranyl pyrophosphate synthase
MQIGIAFQIADDILDAVPNCIQGSIQESSDEKDHKATAVSILGQDEANRCKDLLFSESLSILSTLSRPAPLLEILFHKLVHRNK